MITIVAALTKGRVIGKNGQLPWKVPEEMRQFKALTTGGTVIMGRKTYESIGKPLPERHNIVVSTTMDNQLDVDVCADLPHALQVAKRYGKEIFIIGGAMLYREALPVADQMHLSWIKQDYDGDTRFPPFDEHEWRVQQREQHEKFELVTYRRHHDASDARS